MYPFISSLILTTVNKAEDYLWQRLLIFFQYPLFILLSETPYFTKYMATQHKMGGIHICISIAAKSGNPGWTGHWGVSRGKDAFPCFSPPSTGWIEDVGLSHLGQSRPR